MKKYFLLLGCLCFLGFQTNSYGQSVNSGEVLNNSNAPGQISTDSKEIKELSFSLGEFTTPSKDEALHYIKVEVVMEYEGINDEPLKRNKDKFRDAVNTLLMQITIQQAKKDYIEHALHNSIQKRMQELLTEFAPGLIKIKRILIPAFLIN
ncbi:MAG: flagellar basal body-associated FliL family protein [Candidatus Riflebacteria bacterium]|nr:flagellar basal body-associated FliL family protein [Candidatus Riflebacteria bacterium]